MASPRGKGSNIDGKLRKAFNAIDADKSGTIDSAELLTAMKALGLKAGPAEVKKLMQEVDEDRSGSIDFQEFKKMMSSRLRLLEAGQAGDDLASLVALRWEELKGLEPSEDDFSLPARTHRLAVYSRSPDWKLDEAVAAYSPRPRKQN